MKAYKYRIYPNKAQQEQIDKTLNAARWAYNFGLDHIKKASEAELQRRKEEPESPKQKIPNYVAVSKLITELKKTDKYAWLNEVPRDPITQALMNVDKAFKNFFTRIKKGESQAGYPKFKKRGVGTQAFSIFCPSNKVDFAKSTLTITRIPNIKARFHRHFEGKIKTITISKDTVGAYYASILVESEAMPAMVKREIKPETTISVHSGLRNLLTTSEGVKYDNPRTLKANEKRLAKAQRKLSKSELKYTVETNEFGKERRVYSKNRDKLRLKVNKIHKKIANIREHNLHNISKDIVENERIETICLDNFAIKRMVKDNRFSKNIHDAAWFKFKTMVKYKSEWLGKNVLESDVESPITQRCFECKHIEEVKIPLNKLVWTCSNCGSKNDRDLNAAKNVKEISLNKVSTKS